MLPTVQEFFLLVANQFRTRLVNRSAMNIPIRVANVEGGALGSVPMMKGFSNSSIYGMLRFGAARLPGMLVIQHSLLTQLIAVLLGDSQQPDAGRSMQIRNPTLVEARIARRLCLDLASEMRKVWPEERTQIQFEGGLTVSPRIPEAIRPTQVYVVVLDFGPEGDPSSYGQMCVAVPTHALSNLQSLSQQPAGIEESEIGSDFQSVMPVEVEVVAELLTMSLTVQHLRSLKPGDHINLGSPKNCVVKVNGEPLFTGEPGDANGQRSVKIIDPIGS